MYRRWQNMRAEWRNRHESRRRHMAPSHAPVGGGYVYTPDRRVPEAGMRHAAYRQKITEEETSTQRCHECKARHSRRGAEW